MPADRLAALRSAFDAAVKDKAFLADAEKLGLTVTPMTGGEVESYIRENLQGASRHRRGGEGDFRRLVPPI